MSNIKKYLKSAIAIIFVITLIFSISLVANADTIDKTKEGASEGISEGKSAKTDSLKLRRAPATDIDFLSSSLLTKNPGGKLFSGVGPYYMQFFGNSNVYGFDFPNKHEYKNMHPELGGYNSTSMEYIQKGTSIKKAYLYMAETYYNWGSNPKTDRANTYLLGPKGGRIVFDDGGLLLNKYFDITAFIAQEGSGTYYGVNIDCQASSRDNYDIDAGWQIVVVEEDETFNYRQVSIDGYNETMQNGHKNIKASSGNEGTNLYPPASDITGQYLVSIGGGNSSYSGDYATLFSINDLNVTLGSKKIEEPNSGRLSDDFFRGVISKDREKVTAIAPLMNNNNIDLAVSDIYANEGFLIDGLHDLNFQVATGIDRIYMYMIGIAVDIGVPDIGITNSFGSTGENKIGDTETYTTKLKASENGFSLANPVYSIVFPEGATYIPGATVVKGTTSYTENYDPTTRTLSITFVAASFDGVEISTDFKVESPLTSSSKFVSGLTGENMLPNGANSGMEIKLVSDALTTKVSYPVIVKHVDENDLTLLPDETLTGAIGATYSAPAKTIPRHTFKSTIGQITGFFGEKEIIVTHIYQRTGADVSIRHEGEDGNLLSIANNPEALSGTIGTPYTTSPISDPKYKLVTTPANASGIYTAADQTVTYVYRKITGRAIINYINEDGVPVSPQQIMTGDGGVAYVATPKTIYGYDILDISVNGVYAEQDRIIDFNYKAKEYNMIFHANAIDTTGSMPNMPITFSKTKAMTKNTFVRPGYTFKGWSTIIGDNNGPAVYLDEANYTTRSQSDINHYAVWEIDNLDIIFDPSGGTGTMANIVIKFNETKKLTANAFTKDGHTFLGWSRTLGGSVIDYINEANYTQTTPNNTTLYAVWKAKEYKIIFHGNGPETVGTMANMTISFGIPTPLTKNIYTRDGFGFRGWSTNPKDKVAMYSDEEIYTMAVEGDVDLYAVWIITDYNAHFLYFDSSGGTGTMMEQHYKFYQSDKIKKNTFTKDGYTFIGWTKTSGGSAIDYLDEELYTQTTTYDITIYAVWKANDYNIIFDPSGGSGTMANLAIKFDETKVLTKSTFTKTGYSFAGWTTTSGGSVVDYIDQASYKHIVSSDATLYAVWTANDYSVIFNSSGGIGTMADQVIKYDETKPLTKNTFTKDGYSFMGWSNTIGGTNVDYADLADFKQTTTSNTTIYAVWAANDYNVIFNSSGGAGTIANLPIKFDETKALTKNTFTKTGYSFAGWATSGSLTVDYADLASFKQTTTSDTTLYAVWKANDYNVIFNSSGGTGTMANLPIKFDETKALTKNAFTKNGYSFQGWSSTLGGQSVDFADLADFKQTTTSDTTLYAVWKANDYKVVFHPSGGSGILNDLAIKFDETKTLTPNYFMNAGYFFAGWTTTAGGLVVDYIDMASYKHTVSSNVTLYAVWEAETYEVIFSSYGAVGTMANMPIKFQETKSLTKNSYTWPGYTFEGWSRFTSYPPVGYLDEASYTHNDDRDIVLNAIWKAEIWSISFDLNGGTSAAIPPISVETDGFAYFIDLKILPGQSKAPTRDGYTFKGWTYTKDDFSTLEKGVIKMTPGDRIVYAFWVANDYEVIFDSSGGAGTMANLPIKFDETKPLTKGAFSKTGYIFGGWSTTLGGTTVDYLDEADYNHNVSSNKTLYAVWKANNFNVIFDPSGGTGTMANLPIKFDETKTLAQNSFTKNGYSFSGWSTTLGGATVDYTDLANFKQTTAVDTTLYAVWKANDYNVIFNPSGGTGSMANLPIKFDETKPLTKNTFEKDGYIFSGWSNTLGGLTVDYADLASFKQTATNDTTLYAVWKARDYNIIFNSSGGTGTMANLSIKFDETKPLTKNTFQKVGYTFIGWSNTSGGTTVDFTDEANFKQSTSSDSTVYAVWKAKSYNVIFNSSDGVGTIFNMPIDFNDTKSLTKNTFTKDGYSFSGWSKTALGTVVDYLDEANFKQTVAADSTLYAVWKANEYNIIFSSSGGTGTMANLPIKFNETKNLTKNTFQKAGYSFLGWSKSVGATTVDHADLASFKQTVSSDTTLYAVWKADTKTLIFDLNGGTSPAINPISAKTAEVVNLSTHNLMPGEAKAPTRANYSFVGWTETKNDPTTLVTSQVTMPTTNKILYAYWQGGVFGRVYVDENRNMIVDSKEPGISQNTVELTISINGVAIPPFDIENGGLYGVTNLRIGDLVILTYKVKNPSNYRFTYDSAGNIYTSISKTYTITDTNALELDDVMVMKPYTINYITQYGDKPGSFKAFEGDSVVLPTTISNLTQATFGSWLTDANDDTSAVTDFSQVSVPVANRGQNIINLHASYSHFLVTVKSGPNGLGTIGGAASQMVPKNSAATVDAAADANYVVKSYTNKTSNTTTDVTGPSESATGSNVYSSINRPTTIYVDFIGKKVNIIFNSTGGTAVTNAVARYNEKFSVTPYNLGGKNAPTKVENILLGWSQSAAGGALVSNTITVPSSDLTLYAGWKTNEYKVIFEANGENVLNLPKTITAKFATGVNISNHQPSGANPPTRAGFIFDGWLNPDGTLSADTFTMANKDLILKAKWLSIASSINILKGENVVIYKNESTKADIEKEISVTSEITTSAGVIIKTPVFLDWDDAVISGGGVHKIRPYILDQAGKKQYSEKYVALYVLNRDYITARNYVTFELNQRESGIGTEWSAKGIKELPNFVDKSISKTNFPLSFEHNGFTTSLTGTYNPSFHANVLDYFSVNQQLSKVVTADVLPAYELQTENGMDVNTYRDSLEFWGFVSQRIHLEKKFDNYEIDKNDFKLLGTKLDNIKSNKTYDRLLSVTPTPFFDMSAEPLQILREQDNTLMTVDLGWYGWKFHSNDFSSNLAKEFDPTGFFNLRATSDNKANSKISSLVGNSNEMQIQFEMDKAWMGTPTFRVNLNENLKKSAKNGNSLYMFNYNEDTNELELVGKLAVTEGGVGEISMKEVRGQYVIIDRLPGSTNNSSSLESFRITEQTNPISKTTLNEINKTLTISNKTISDISLITPIIESDIESQILSRSTLVSILLVLILLIILSVLFLYIKNKKRKTQDQ